MKRTFTLLASTCLLVSVSAQQPQNGGFENWTASTIYMDALSYYGSGQQSYFATGAGNVYSVSSPVQGVLAAHLETVTNGTDTVTGMLLHGIPSGNSIDGGSAYTSQPDSLVFWANHDVMPGDTALCVVAFEKLNSIYGYGIGYMTGNSGSCVRYSFPISYQFPIAPDSIGLIISSSNLFSGIAIPGSTVEIDNIQLIGATQQVPNPYFEVWAPSIVNEPDGWATLNFANVYDGNYSVMQDNSAYMGSYDCMIETTVAEWGDTIGYITNGNFNGQNGPGGGMAVYQNPQKITGYYKYIPVGNDTALAGAWTHRWDVVGDSAVPYEEQLIWLPATNTWTYFEINLTYNQFPYPDTMAIAFASSNFENFVGINLGSQLFIDEVGVSYFPLGMDDHASSVVSVFPNPTTRFLNVRLENVAEGSNTINIYDATGQLVRSEKFSNASQSGFFTLEVSDMAAGTYIWKIQGTDSQSGTFVKE